MYCTCFNNIDEIASHNVKNILLTLRHVDKMHGQVELPLVGQ